MKIGDGNNINKNMDIINNEREIFENENIYKGDIHE